MSRPKRREKQKLANKVPCVSDGPCHVPTRKPLSTWDGMDRSPPAATLKRSVLCHESRGQTQGQKCAGGVLNRLVRSAQKAHQCASLNRIHAVEIPLALIGIPADTTISLRRERWGRPASIQTHDSSNREKTPPFLANHAEIPQQKHPNQGRPAVSTVWMAPSGQLGTRHASCRSGTNPKGASARGEAGLQIFILLVTCPRAPAQDMALCVPSTMCAHKQYLDGNVAHLRPPTCPLADLGASLIPARAR